MCCSLPPPHWSSSCCSSSSCSLAPLLPSFPPLFYVAQLTKSTLLVVLLLSQWNPILEVIFTPLLLAATCCSLCMSVFSSTSFHLFSLLPSAAETWKVVAHFNLACLLQSFHRFHGLHGGRVPIEKIHLTCRLSLQRPQTSVPNRKCSYSTFSFHKKVGKLDVNL